MVPKYEPPGRINLYMCCAGISEERQKQGIEFNEMDSSAVFGDFSRVAPNFLLSSYSSVGGKPLKSSANLFKLIS